MIENTKIVDGIEIYKPEFVYLNYSIAYAKMLATVNFPEDVDILVPEKDGITDLQNNSGCVIIIQNNGNFEVKIPSTEKVFNELMKGFFKTEKDVQKHFGRITKVSSDKKPEIVGAILDGKEISFEEFKKQNGEVETEFIYRAVRVEEWEGIRKNKKWFVRANTNFVNQDMFDSSSDQSRVYQNHEGYAGRFIRYKAPKNFVMIGGNGDRVVSTMPHIANEIEVSNDGKVWTKI
jgi:hypothetical protein